MNAMRRAPLSLMSFGLLLGLVACTSGPRRDYPIQPVPFHFVRVNDAFWRPRLETNRRVTIPHNIRMLEETGRIQNFAIAAGRVKGAFQGKRYNDSDVYKVLEGAAYSLRVHPDYQLASYLDGLIEIIGDAQEPDGYLYTARTADPANPPPGAGSERWSLLRSSHELYNVGHLYEAAVAYAQATARERLLDTAQKNAQLLLQTFGPGLRQDFPGHQEIEIGLVKLFRWTGNRRYLDLAKFFLEARGRTPGGKPFPEDSPFAIYNDEEYLQNHKPVAEQREAKGHAVRATYMYSGMTDVGVLTADQAYLAAVRAIWEDIVFHKIYLTGGLGSEGASEGFGPAYELPNGTAYAETCAAIGSVLWNHRMFLLHGEARYVDLLERTLYNGVLSGVGLSGDAFFYQNPLQSKGDYARSPWFEVACCPPNIERLLPQVPGFIYARSGNRLYVNLFIGGTAKFGFRGGDLIIKQDTRYPWEGSVRIVLQPKGRVSFDLCIRIPGWSQGAAVPGELYRFQDASAGGYSVKVNGEPVDVTLDKGYVVIHRSWKKGDTVELDLPMPVRRVLAHDRVAADRDKVALQRGPLVYCVEAADNPAGVFDLVLTDDTSLEVEFLADLLGGIIVLKGRPAAGGSRSFMAIPYAYWANRGANAMTVWLGRSPSPAKPK